MTKGHSDTLLARPFAPEAAAPRPAPLGGIAPIVPVQNVAASRRFYVDRLGFTLLQENPDASAAMVERGAVRLMLLRVPHKRALEATREYLSAYIWTPDADALFAELAPKLADLPDWRVRAPFTQPYGMREFHVKDPDGFLLFFAEDPFAPKGSAPRH
ncbi:MAG: VOC family protein [Pseudomonadota bacterium]